jgi:Ca2+-binding RTX toxin-like protein
VTLTGTNPTSLLGNNQDNTLQGNQADNTIDGKSGEDTIVLCANRSEFEINTGESTIMISRPEGVDTITDIESIHFADGKLNVEELD